MWAIFPPPAPGRRNGPSISSARPIASSSTPAHPDLPQPAPRTDGWNSGYGRWLSNAPHRELSGFTSTNGVDGSDRVQVLNNHLGPFIAAEPVDIKEGTYNGIIRGNVFKSTICDLANIGSWAIFDAPKNCTLPNVVQSSSTVTNAVKGLSNIAVTP